MENSIAIRQAGWRQGSLIVLDEASPRLRELLQHAQPFAFWIVVSQDCDLLLQCYKAEPHVELLGCNPIANANGNFTGGKNPRRVHFSASMRDREIVLEAFVSDRFCVDRSVLETMAPCTYGRLGPLTVYTLADWIARRYSRSAFPDAFNDRLKPKQRGFKRLLEDHGEIFSGIYFELSSFEELASTSTYTISARLVMRSRDYADASLLDRALNARNGFEICLEECQGIDVKRVDVVSETDFTLADLDFFTAWDGFDYLSNATGWEA